MHRILGVVDVFGIRSSQTRVCLHVSFRGNRVFLGCFYVFLEGFGGVLTEMK